MSKLIIFNKPFHVLSQFTDETGRKTLSDFINIQKVYPAGRLDFDSEGLLLLTDDGKLQSLISHPKYKLTKTYWVQVEGIADQQHCEKLLDGIELKDGLACAINCKTIIQPDVWDRNPPIRVRKTIADSWIELSISEGRNRQVRRMTAAVGLPTLRLIRAKIGKVSIKDVSIGEHKVVKGNSAAELLKKFLRDET